jgi:uncharacterized protein with PIN domain
MDQAVKIDKRTKEYKAMIQNPERVVESKDATTMTDKEMVIDVLGTDAEMAPNVVTPVIPVDYHKSGSNPGFTVCSECGGPLEPNDDGTPKYRRQPEACWDCVHKNENKILCKDGVIRDKEDCKRVTRMVNAKDEVYEWVVK